jgi:2-phospho-L-lactate guanylyltransferase
VSVAFIIPFRGLKLGKTRLRARLPDADVETLSKRMLGNVLTAIRHALPDAPSILVTRDGAGVSAPPGVALVEQPLDLNSAIEFARRHLAQRGVDRVAVIPADLPLLQVTDVIALLAPAADVVLAPDLAQGGTNALVYPAGQADFARFGVDSAQRHAAEAAIRGLSFARVTTAALSRDVDIADHIDAAVRAACAPARVRT